VARPARSAGETVERANSLMSCVGAASTTSATISPTTLQNMNRWPENPPAFTTSRVTAVNR
jgi:hypothetical protein